MPPRIGTEYTPLVQALSCPPNEEEVLNNSNWKPYHGMTSVFHCGQSVFLENRDPTPDNPQLECAYDPNYELVTGDCGGTPNDYDARKDPWNHTFNDRGGPRYVGVPAFIESMKTWISELLFPSAW